MTDSDEGGTKAPEGGTKAPEGGAEARTGETGATRADAEAEAAKAAAKLAKRAARAAKAEARAAKRTAKVEAKAAAKAARAARKATKRAARKTARKAAQARARERRAERMAAKAARRAAAGDARASSAVSAVLEEAAELLRHGEATPAPPIEPPAAVPDPEPAPENAGLASGSEEPEPEPEPEPAPELAGPETTGLAPEPGPESTEPVPTPSPPGPAAAIAVPAGATVAAAIDVGSTSVHLLVGLVEDHHVVPLLDESVFLGLGDRVLADGYLGADLRASLLEDLERYVRAARDLGAVSVTIVGTEPMRRAADAAVVVREVQARTGCPLYVLDYEEEGRLTLIGVTGGSPVDRELLLVEVGGGSSEVVVVGPGGRSAASGLDLGASRLTQDVVRSDPPSGEEMAALRAEVARLIVRAPDARPAAIVAVGGNASNLLRLLPAAAGDHELSRERIAVALAMLAAEPSGEAAERHLIRPERARILPAGALIVDAVLERYGLDRLRVSETGMREGAILAAARGGAAWRDGLAGLAMGWPEAIVRPG